MKQLNSVMACVIAVLLFSCSKIDLSPRHQEANSSEGIIYTIKKGSHSCDKNDFISLELSELKFTVRFDQSAVYQTAEPGNQLDVNKLYGFADNGSQHHEFSARFGWRWSENALRLFAYVYNNGAMDFQEITSITTDKEYECSITISPDTYTFRVNGKTVIMPRASTTPKAKGYRLYPYFGGDEPAPHDIRIWIREAQLIR